MGYVARNSSSLPPLSPTLFPAKPPPFLPILSFPYRHSSPLLTSFSFSHPRFTFSPPLPLYDILSSIPPSFRFVFPPIPFFFPSPAFFRIHVLLLPFPIVSHPFLLYFDPLAFVSYSSPWPLFSYSNLFSPVF